MLFRKSFRLMYNTGFETIKKFTGNERNVFVITRHNHTFDKSKLKPEDTFGTLTSQIISYSQPDDDENTTEEDYFGKIDTVKKMKICLNAHEYDNALQLLKVMQKKEKAPDFAYRLLISYNAKIGNAQEAFRLFNDFKKRGYYKKHCIFTSLFVACGNCPRSDIALQIAHKLLKQVLESEKKPNLWVYHAMLKAFGRHGEFSVACQLMDRLREKKIKITSETYSRLLESCITDKSSGLRFALLIWHHMLKENLKPNLFIFKTMAKCIQNCSLGDVDLIKDFINFIVGHDSLDKTNQGNHIISNESQMLTSGHETILNSLEKHSTSQWTTSENESSSDLFVVEPFKSCKISNDNVGEEIEESESGNVISVCETSSEDINLREFGDMELPNVFHPQPTWGSVVELGDMSKRHNRFLLFGGLEGFFKVMDHFQIKPDIAIFSILLFCIPPTKKSLEKLITWKEKYNVKTDIRFANSLWKRRIMTGDTFEDFMDYLKNTKVRPNVETIRVLAQTCKTPEEFKKWTEITKRERIRITDRHIYALLQKAYEKHDMNYVSDILALAKEEGVELSPKCLGLLKTTLIGESTKTAQIQ